MHPTEDVARDHGGARGLQEAQQRESGGEERRSKSPKGGRANAATKAETVRLPMGAVKVNTIFPVPISEANAAKAGAKAPAMAPGATAASTATAVAAVALVVVLPLLKTETTKTTRPSQPTRRRWTCSG